MTVAATSKLQEHLSAASSYRYRADVDGLRAIAIVPVVAFHAGLPGVDGGFVGVDVFFVISGFLISGMLLDELRRTDRIDLPRFYARRARRLFPALALVCLVTLALGAMLLLPFGEQQELAQSSIATSFFASNVFFWMKSGYFDAPAEQRPLLNMWTLSVEEQFYWVWPLLLFAVWQGTRLATRASRLRTASIATVCVLIFAMSLASCIFTNTVDEHFVIDRLPDAPQVLVVSPCSGHGYKFTSVIGEIVADLVLDGGSRFDLSMFALSRVFPAA